MEESVYGGVISERKNKTACLQKAVWVKNSVPYTVGSAVNKRSIDHSMSLP